MADGVWGRSVLLKALREELVGPSPAGTEVPSEGVLRLTTRQEAYVPHRQSGSGEEILQRDRPSLRYGVGVLFPAGSPPDEDTIEPAVDTVGLSTHGPRDNGDPAASESTVLSEAAQKAIEESRERSWSSREDDYNADVSPGGMRSLMPSSMGISFLCALSPGSTLRVRVTAGRYGRRSVNVENQERDWWFRSPVEIVSEFDAETLCSGDESTPTASRVDSNGTEGLDLRVEVLSRRHEDDRQRLITVSLVNRSQGSAPIDERCIFQSHFTASVDAPDGEDRILAYPKPPFETLDPDEQVLALLYRYHVTFGVGHGCAADWSLRTERSERAQCVSAECMPVFEAPSMTPDVLRSDGSTLEIPMASLAFRPVGAPIDPTIDEVLSQYGSWIATRRQEVPSLEPQLRETAERNLDKCEACLRRASAGIRLIESDAQVALAFRLANEAVLMQQLRSRREPRRAVYDATAKRLTFDEQYPLIDPLNARSDRGKWRAFQIVFLLMSLESTACASSSDRESVELLWFPTGGGKTEAYFGLAAFSMFLRRIRNPSDVGVDVLMRYTLRLLTAQQFLRASGLICAMEVIRRGREEALGAAPFTIGIWLGSATTPNTRDEAHAILQGLLKGDKYAENKFMLTRCPWCGAQIGPVSLSMKGKTKTPSVLGYEWSGGTVLLRCSDQQHCPFAAGLPVCLIDEDIYERPPTMLVSTVDKFALLTWRPEARALFGLGPAGNRIASPPNLIIQDELHLIAGPLGSMVGLYELLIEELCTRREHDTLTRPKLVCATATVRTYSHQIQALYNRRAVTVFPPPGLEEGDSFFARHARRPDGSPANGRVYVGVHGPSMGSVQTAQVRTFASLLEGPMALAADTRDPWWTLVAFFNSLRELGTTLSLLQSDIPDYLLTLRRRAGTDYSSVRRLFRVWELTSRLKNDEIPNAIADLEVAYSEKANRSTDVCLASSIIEVGIDIDRLSLMTVVGQPKTTSQYIQATGRIGRRWWERPGLVVVIYNPSRPRDRSHFEQFRSYHECLHAHVEPTSLTPFASPTVERAIHAVMAAYCRQTGHERMARSPDPCPKEALQALKEILAARIEAVDPDELTSAIGMFDRRVREWDRWHRTSWSARGDDSDAPLLREAGAYVSPQWQHLSWPTPTSLRNVDAECQMEISHIHLLEEVQNA